MDPKILVKILRVNHAGEFGALQIYKGQKWILGEHDEILNEMEDQEKVHLSFFQNQLVIHGVSVTLFYPLWKIGGFALGAFTALLKQHHGCTIAVESVIEEHYASQLELMDPTSALAKAILTFKEDESAHKNTALREGGENKVGYKILNRCIQKITRTAIFLSSRH